jgi:hypothetical protein
MSVSGAIAKGIISKPNIYRTRLLHVIQPGAIAHQTTLRGPLLRPDLVQPSGDAQQKKGIKR